MFKLRYFIPYLIITSAIFSKPNNNYVYKHKEINRNIDSLKALSLSAIYDNEIALSGICNQRIKSKTSIPNKRSNLTNPIYYRNNINIDNNLSLLDFYIYEYTDNYLQVFGRIKNTKNVYLEWTRITFGMYSEGEFIDTDFTYIECESYGSYGISPYKTAFINTFIDKVDFDSIGFQVDYDLDTGSDYLLWDQMLELQSVSITKKSDIVNEWKGVVRNQYNYSMSYPCIYAGIFKQGKMIALDYTFLDVPDYKMNANSTAYFNSYIDLPQVYDEIKYFINYSLSSLEGNGNLPPNKPIITDEILYGQTRKNECLGLFLIDPEKNPIDCIVDLGNDSIQTSENLSSNGLIQEICFTYPDSGVYRIKARINDGISQTEWSDTINAFIGLSTIPKIQTDSILAGTYKKPYSFQCQSNGGITPINWQIQEGYLPNGMRLDANTGRISGTPLSSGEFNLTLSCYDSGIPSESDSANLILRILNQKPEIISPDTIRAQKNTLLSYTANSIDPNQNQVNYQFIDYPKWLSVNQSIISGVVPFNASDSSFILIASDGELSDSIKVNVKIDSINGIDHSQYPMTFSVSETFPNPFNQETNFKLYLPNSENVKITVFDIKGKMISDLSKGQLKEGIHTVTWKADKFPSGIYFIQVKTNKINKIIKSTLIK